MIPLEACEKSGIEMRQQLAHKQQMIEDIRQTRIYDMIMQPHGRRRNLLDEYGFRRVMYGNICGKYKVMYAGKGMNERMLLYFLNTVFQDEPIESYNGFNLVDILDVATADRSRYIDDEPIILKRHELEPHELDIKGRYKCIYNLYRPNKENRGQKIYRLRNFTSYPSLTDIFISCLISKKDSPEPYTDVHDFLNMVLSNKLIMRIPNEDIEDLAKQLSKIVSTYRTKYDFNIEIVQGGKNENNEVIYSEYKYKFICLGPRSLDTEWYKEFGVYIFAFDRINPYEMDKLIINQIAHEYKLVNYH